MSGSDNTAPGTPNDDNDDNDKMFTASVRGPGGNEYYIQASHAFNISGPVFIGRGPDPEPFTSGRTLGLVNKLLMRLQRPRHTESTLVVVFRIEGDDEEEAVHLESASDMADARARVVSIATEIEAGTFRFFGPGDPHAAG